MSVAAPTSVPLEGQFSGPWVLGGAPPHLALLAWCVCLEGSSAEAQRLLTSGAPGTHLSTDAIKASDANKPEEGGSLPAAQVQWLTWGPTPT